MLRQTRVGLVLAALVFMAAFSPVAGQVIEKTGQTTKRPDQSGKNPGTSSQTPESSGKKRYSRGIVESKSAPATPSAAAAPALTWDPFIGMDQQIFPSFIVSTATLRLPQEEDAEEDPRQLGETLGFIGASLESVPANSALKVEIKANAAMETSVFEGKATAGAGDYELYPKINFKYDALLDWRQPMPLNIAMEVFVDGRSLGTRSTTVTVRSINDCPFAIVSAEESDEEDLDLSWMFAAYVNENHPWVDTLTREAIGTKIIDSFTAYQSEERAEVLRQVYALWDTLQRRGVHYSDISQSSAESDIVLSQHVRLFDETVTAQQANCVDGTVMLAAVLRKIGIQPYLVTVPGHMFLAFDLDEEGEETVGLETTMMGTTDAEAVKSRNPTVPAELGRQYRNRPSFLSFSAAIESGTAQLNEAAEKFESDDADYQLISLSEARSIGILPLAYRKK